MSHRAVNSREAELPQSDKGFFSCYNDKVSLYQKSHILNNQNGIFKWKLSNNGSNLEYKHKIGLS